MGFFSAARAPAIRPLKATDANAVAAIHAEGFARGWPASDIQRMIIDPAMVGDGATTSRWPGALSGFALSRLAADEAEILSIAVKRSERGKGVAAALMASHLSRVAERGARAIFLEVEDGNAAAIALYRRFGFHDVGRRQAYYRKPDGSAAHAIIMRRELG